MLQVGHPGGLCNRLDTITTGYMLCQLENEEELEVIWPVVDHHMPASFAELFVELPYGRIVEGNIAPNVLQNYYTKAARLAAGYRESRPYGEMLRRLLNNVVPAVEDEVSTFMDGHFQNGFPGEESTVGVHVRRTEQPYPLCEFAQPLRYYEALMRSFPRMTRFFVSTDSQEAFRWLEARFGDRVFQRLKRHDDRGSVDGVREGLIDMLLLSRCDAIIGTHRSSFSHMAAIAGGCPSVRLKAVPEFPPNWPSFSRLRWCWGYRHFLVESTFWKRWLFYIVRPQLMRIPKIPARGLQIIRGYASRLPS